MATGLAGIAIVKFFGGVITNRIVPNREQQHISQYLMTSAAQEEYLFCAANVLQQSFRDYRASKSPLTSQRSTAMYAAMKNFRRAQCAMEQAVTPANDPVIDNKVMAIADIVIGIQAELERQQESIGRVQGHIDAKFLDIIKMLEKE